MIMLQATNLALLSCGAFFMTGLITGVWKYRGMISSDDGQAPTYVDICHRAALMYAFACLVLAEFARLSSWSAKVNLVAVLLPVVFFAAAVGSYALHGLLRDTDNQLRRPHVMGKRHVHGRTVSTFIYLLAAGEIGGFAVLLTGSVPALV
jgi:hypothetical protein